LLEKHASVFTKTKKTEAVQSFLDFVSQVRDNWNQLFNQIKEFSLNYDKIAI